MPYEKSDDRTEDLSDLLRLAQKRFSSLLKSLPIGVVVIRSDGTIEAVNAAIVKIFGYDEGFLVGKHIGRLFIKTPWDDGKQFKDWCVNNIGNVFELTGLAIEDELVPIDFVVHQLDSDSQERLLITVQDVSERVLANKVKSEFFGMINHDIRSPLTAVVMFLKLLDQPNGFGSLTDVGRQRLGIAEQNLNRILQLADGLLELDKLETSAGNLQYTPVSLKKLVEGSISAVLELAETKQIQIIPTIEDRIIEADVVRLEQVLVNLLGNAISYSPVQMPITITNECRGKTLRVAIRDHGPGIPDSEKKHVFEKFKQGSGKKSGGFGLGLAICKEIIRLHKGTIGCQDAQEGGTIFWFELPLGFDH